MTSRRWKAVAAALAITAIVAGGTGLLRSAPGADAQAATFAVGASVVVDTDGLNLRADPGLSGSIVDVLPFGATGTILAGPQDLDGYTWYGLDIDGETGWVAGDYLAAIESTGAYAVGATLIVNTDLLNLRADAGLDAAIEDVIPGGATVTIADAPVEADGYLWYPVDYEGESGWVAGDHLAPSVVGETVTVTAERVNLRAGPSLADDVVATLAYGTTGSIVSGPVDGEGYHWYEVAIGNQTGWVAGEYVEAA